MYANCMFHCPASTDIEADETSRCRILVHMSGGKGVLIKATETYLYYGIDRAAERGDRAVVRLIEQLRGFYHARVFGASALQR